MPKKTYRTYFLKGLDIHVQDEDGKRIEVVFRGGIQIDSTAKFSTSDEKIQNILENLSGFGRDYYLESVQEAAPVAAPAAPKEEDKPAEPKKILADVKDSRRFRNLVEMKNAMAELGISVTPEMNYMSAKAAAAKEGYDFQIQK